MKRRMKSEMGTFSASAIDLFASALGAFIIITIVLFPYFPNLSPDPLEKIIEQLRADKQGLENQVTDLNDQVASISYQNDALTDQNQQLSNQNSNLKNQNSGLRTQNSDLQNQIDGQSITIQKLQSGQADKDRQIADLQGRLNGAAFIGIEPNQDNIQIVIDYSGSTQDYTTQINNAVRLIVDRLVDGKHSLRIVSFELLPTGPKYTYWPTLTGFQSTLTSVQKDSAIDFVTNRLINPRAGTPTFEVMSQVVSVNKPSAIFLITDGIPTGITSETDMGNNIALVTSQNADRHQVNIVAIGKFIADPLASSIVPLATQNGGVLVAMP